MITTRARIAALICLVALVATAQRAVATPPAGPSTEERIRSFVQANGLPSFSKQGRVWFATRSGANMSNGAQSYLGQLSQPNMVEFFVSPGFHHLYTRIGDKTYSRIIGLSESSWYASSSERVGVLAQLSDSEMGRLKSYVASACRNPDAVIGPFNYGGGRPPQASNCTSWVTYAKIGDRGETLAQLLGVYESGFPQGFLRSLIGSRSDRIKAVVVHNPRSDFNEQYQPNLN